MVYEKRLIEQYINENGTEPSTGEALTADDLLPVKSSRIVRPRPPTLTSIPALLATFQNEWDALALETYNLKEQLARTREELATALYQHDAAVRVIARLTKERDAARDALSRLTVAEGAANGEGMDVDSVEALPAALAAHVDETHKEWVTPTRRDRIYMLTISSQAVKGPQEAPHPRGLGHQRGGVRIRQRDFQRPPRVAGDVAGCGWHSRRSGWPEGPGGHLLYRRG